MWAVSWARVDKACGLGWKEGGFLVCDWLTQKLLASYWLKEPSTHHYQQASRILPSLVQGINRGHLSSKWTKLTYFREFCSTFRAQHLYNAKCFCVSLLIVQICFAFWFLHIRRKECATLESGFSQWFNRAKTISRLNLNFLRISFSEIMKWTRAYKELGSCVSKCQVAKNGVAIVDVLDRLLLPALGFLNVTFWRK